MSSASGSLVILVVEDNRGDVVLFQEAIEHTQTPATVHVVSNGGDAMHFLLCRDRYAEAPRPGAASISPRPTTSGDCRIS